MQRWQVISKVAVLQKAVISFKDGLEDDAVNSRADTFVRFSGSFVTCYANFDIIARKFETWFDRLIFSLTTLMS